MLREVSVIPLGRGLSISADIVDLVKIIDASSLDYRVTAAGTIIEGSWDQLMDLARRCPVEMRKERVINSMNVDDYAYQAGMLTGAIALHRGKLGKPGEEVTNAFVAMRPAREPWPAKAPFYFVYRPNCFVHHSAD